jgi:cytidine deaminase
VALWKAVSAGARTFRALAVVAGGGALPYPCGACRQVLREFCRPGLPVYVAPAGDLRAVRRLRLGDLLPHAFAGPTPPP